MMTETRRDAMVEDLREARRRVKGIMRATLTFECANAGQCPVQTVRLEVVERPGIALTQPKMVCPRCRQELVYVDCDPR